MSSVEPRRVRSVRRIAALAAAAVLLAAAPLRADDGDDARKGFDFGKPGKEGGKAPTKDKSGKAAGKASDGPSDPIQREIAGLRGWPDRKATHAAEALYLRQKEAIPYLVHALKDGDPDVQAGAAWVLGQVGETVHVQVILGAAAQRPNASRADVFFKAAYGLGASETKDWLIGFLTVANRPVFREKAAEFLVDKVGPENRRKVLNLLESAKAPVRIAGLKLIESVGVEDVNERLIQALSDLAPSVAYEAARLLALRADDELIQRLNALAREGGARERAYAIIVLVEAARAHATNPFEDATVLELSGRRGILHPERLSRGAAAVGLAYGGLESQDPNIAALLDGPVVDTLIQTLGGSHFRDYASLTPGLFAALRRLSGRDLPDTAVAWAQWWRDSRGTFRARRPLQRMDAADLPQSYVRFEVIEANGRRMHAEFTPETGAGREGAFILNQRAYEGLVSFLDGEGIFRSVERGGVRADEHVAATIGVLNQRKRMVVSSDLPRATATERDENRRRYQRIRMRVDALVAANAWQRYRDTDKWSDARAWWKANAQAMAEAGPDQQRALLRAAIIASYDDLPDDVARAEALVTLQRIEGRMLAAEARQLAAELTGATTFGRMEADGLRWIIEQGHAEVREEISNALADRQEPEAREILAGLLLDGGAERIRIAFADPRPGMRAAGAHAARLFVEGGSAGQLAPDERQRLHGRLRPGLEVLSLDDDPRVSISALIALAYLGDVTVVEKLEQLYRTGSLNVKLEVTKAMGYVPDKRSHRFLTFVMAAERTDGGAAALRIAALEAMARTNHRDAVRLLRYYMLNDKDDSVRDAAGRILADVGTVEARFAIVELLSTGEPDAERRARLVDVLGRFRGEVVPSLLRRYLGDEDAGVRAVAALRAAEHNQAEAFPFLLQLLRRGSGPRRDSAVEAIENLTSVRFGASGYAARADRYAAWHEDPRIKGGTDRSWFREALLHKGYDVGPLASYLKGDQDTAAVPLLARVLRDDDAVLRRNASVALERLTGRSFGRVDRATPATDAARIADQWTRWYEQHKPGPR